MIITEEMRKSLPVITEEELKELRRPTEEIIAEVIRDFGKWADEIDAQYASEQGNRNPEQEDKPEAEGQDDE